MLRSFIAQLVCQWRFDTSTLRDHIDLESVQLNNGSAICRIFSWLVRQLPKDRTVMCIIDNIGYYERETTVEETVEVLGMIAHLMQEPPLRATTKLLATSDAPLRETREVFGGETITNLAAVTNYVGSSRSRLQRQLDAELESGDSFV